MLKKCIGCKNFNNVFCKEKINNPNLFFDRHGLEFCHEKSSPTTNQSAKKTSRLLIRQKRISEHDLPRSVKLALFGLVMPVDKNNLVRDYWSVSFFNIKLLLFYTNHLALEALEEVYPLNREVKHLYFPKSNCEILNFKNKRQVFEAMQQILDNAGHLKNTAET